MGVSFGRKLIFLDHPRTGGTSTQFGLARIGGKTYDRHCMVYGKANIICSTVRNPYDILVSWYLIIKERGLWGGSFLSFIKGYENYNFTRGGRLFYFVEACNEIMHFESLQEDLTRVLKLAKIPNIKLQHRNVTPNRKPYKEYYGEMESTAVANRFTMDIKEFGYEF